MTRRRETSLTDPDGNKTQWAYDSDDRVTTMTEPNGSTVTYVYDQRRRADRHDRRGRPPHDLLIQRRRRPDRRDLGRRSPSEKITYTYDADNEMTGAADSFATLTFTYNADGELATDATSGPGTHQPTVTLTYSYDQLGDETSVTDSLTGSGEAGQGITTYAYNDAQQDDGDHDILRRHGRPAGRLHLRLRQPADLDVAARSARPTTATRSNDVELRRGQPRDDHHGLGL